MTKRSSKSRERKAQAAAEKAQAKTVPPVHTPGSARMSHATRFGVIFLIVAAVVFGLLSLPGRPGRVWSAEHGHWHDANGREIGAPMTAGSATDPTAPPAPGQVWSAEHGHWHDAEGTVE